jgi:hypothetical protein
MLHGRSHLSVAPSAVVNCPSISRDQKRVRELIEQETGVKPVQVAGCDVHLLRRAGKSPDRPAS